MTKEESLNLFEPEVVHKYMADPRPPDEASRKQF
jgi:hypothetical protein